MRKKKELKHHMYSTSTCLAREQSFSTKDLVKDMFPNMTVNSTEWIIQEIDVSAVVDSSG